MFQKEGSSIVSRQKKKAKDVPVRKSDRRALRQRAGQLLFPQQQQQQQQQEEVLDAAFLQGLLVSRQILLPDAKATVFVRIGGAAQDELNNHKGALLWPYNHGEAALWMQLDSKTLFHANSNKAEVVHLPTPLLLSVMEASLVPTIQVPCPVSKFLCRGANLMRAGMRRWVQPPPSFDEPMDGTSKKAASSNSSSQQHRVVAIAVEGNPQPFAVGILAADLAVSNYDVVLQENSQGVGVQIVTCYGDDWWRQQQQQQQQTSNNDNSQDVFSNYGNPGFFHGQYVLPLEVQDATTENDLSPQNDKETADPATSNGASQEGSTESQNDTCPNHLVIASDETEPNTTMTSPEEILHRAVCQALARLKRSDLPMRVATFYAQHVLTVNDDTIDLKATKYKKFGNYIQEQAQQGLLQVGPDPKNKQDAMALLVDYDRRHEDLQSYIQQAKEQAAVTGDSNGQMTPKNARMVLMDLFSIPQHFIAPLRLDLATVKAMNATSEERKGTGLLTAKEIRALLDDYVARESLVDRTNPEFVLLDGPLTDALYKTKKKSSPGSAVPDRLPRKDLWTAWAKKMQQGYALVQVPGNKIIKLSRGKAPVVTVEVTMRQSRKFVTHVRGLDQFGLNDAEAVCQEVTRRFGCAGSVDTSGKAKELVFQGNLADELEALLTGNEKISSHGGAKDSPYRLPKNSVDIVLRKGVPARKR